VDPQADDVQLADLDRLAGELDNPHVALVMGGATKIKQYVFESAKLPEIRGASALLDRINLVDLPALFGQSFEDQEKQKQKRADSVRTAFSERHNGQCPPACPESVIYANGGEILAFAPTTLAATLADEIEWLYTSETLVANSVAVWRPCSLAELRFGLRPGECSFNHLQQVTDQYLRRMMEQYYAGATEAHVWERKNFGELATALAVEKVRRREGNIVRDRSPKPVAHIETNPYARRCRSCERRNAVVERQFEGETEALCEPCARKRAFGQMAKKEGESQIQWFSKAEFAWEPQAARAWATLFEGWLKDNPGDAEIYYQGASHPVKPAEDLEDIAEASSPTGFVAAVYADANNMGGLLQSRRTPNEYQKLAQRTYQLAQDAVFSALARHLNPVEGRHPFEILSIGGDDVFLLVPAHQALPIAVALASAVEEGSAQVEEGYNWESVQRIRRPNGSATQQSELAFSVGVLIADEHTPVFLLNRLAGELLKSAKTKASRLRGLGFHGATVDFQSLKATGMIATNIQDFRKDALQCDGRSLTAKPYTLAELNALLDGVRQLKTGGFPKSQLIRLREQARAGRLASSVDYLYLQARSQHPDLLRGALDEVWVGHSPGSQTQLGLWLRPDDPTGPEWETVLGDLVEIYDFVPEKER
jgi:CRISPR-associated protein Cmr2